QQMKRRLQRRVETVFARLVRELRPFGRGQRDALRMAETFAGVAVIAKEAGAEAIETASGRRHEIDRVSWLRHGRVRSFAGPATRSPRGGEDVRSREMHDPAGHDGGDDARLLPVGRRTDD